MPYLALTFFGFIVAGVLVIILDSLFLHIGARMAGVRRATFGKAVKAAIACALSTLLLAFLFSVVPVAGTGLGFIIGLVLTVLVIQATYRTGFGKAFLLWLFNVAAQIAALLVTAFLLTGVLSVAA